MYKDRDDRVKELVEEKTKYLNHEEGETVDIEEWQDCYIQASAEMREQNQFSLTTRDK